MIDTRKCIIIFNIALSFLKPFCALQVKKIACGTSLLESVDMN